MAKSLLSMVTIGGRSFEGEERFDVVDPASGQPFASAPLCGKEELEEAVSAAQAGQAEWARNERLRREAIESCAAIIARNLPEIAALITQEQGKPIAESRSEVEYAVQVFSQYATMALPSKDLSNGASTRTLLLNRPFGIVGLITPWNFPIGTIAVKLAPALLAGNAVILKPSPIAPLSPLLLGKLLRRALPPGILNTLSGDNKLGEEIARHPQIRKLSVTASTATGRSILKDAAEELKSVTLELGGNDPAIILPDCKPREIAEGILESAWRNAGQVCSAIKRVYAHESLYSEISEALVEASKAYKVGHGQKEETRIGPLTTGASRNRFEAYCQSAQNTGAKVIPASRSNRESGFFVSPSIVANIDPQHPLVLEEQFCPILPVVSYKTLDEAIEWSNATNFGLSASVWTSNPSIGYDVAAQLECGRVGVNGHRRASSDAPFGGFKHSGLGRELGTWGLSEMVETQVVNIFK